VFDGDEIRICETVFVAHVHGGMPAPRRQLLRGAAADAGGPGADAAVQDKDGPRYVQLDCPSGLTLFRGAEAKFQASAIAKALGLVVPAHLVVDSGRLGCPLPACLPEPQHLFDWLAPSLLAASPVIVGPVADDRGFAIVDQGWGKNALVCIYSRCEQAELLAHLRELAGGANRHRGAIEGDIPGPFWPCILATVLSNGSRHFADKVFARIEAVFQEVHSGQRWGIFARREFAQILQSVNISAVEGYDDLANVPR